MSYEELCRSNLYWKDILDYLDIKDKYNFTFTNSFRELNLDYDVELLNKVLLYTTSYLNSHKLQMYNTRMNRELK